MASTIKLGTVKFPAGKVFPSRHAGGGERCNVVVVHDDNTESTAWFDATAVERFLKKGDSVFVSENRNGTATITLTPELQATLNERRQVAGAIAAPAAPRPDTPAPARVSETSPELAEEAFDQRLRVAAARYHKAVTMAKHVAANALGINEECLASPEYIAIVKEIAAALFIESNKR